MTRKVARVNEGTVVITEAVSKTTEYDIPTLKKQRARLVEWTAKFVAERDAEIAEIDRILDLIASGNP